MRKLFFIIPLLVLICAIIFISGCVQEREEVIEGIEWFQTGNTQDITKFQTKLSEELEDNRIGSLWDLKTPDYYGDPNRFFHDINDLGLKWIRVDIDIRDWVMVDWSAGQYSKYQIEPHQNKTITGLAEKNIRIVYCLVFWDPESPGQEEEEGYSRFKTEKEIQNYLNYTRFIVHNFKDRIEYYEILNEPNIGQGTQQHVELNDYINLVKRVIPVIREEQPEAKIIVGATSNLNEPDSHKYTLGLLRSDIMPLVDAISFHPMYGDASPQFDKEYYYNYPSLIRGIKHTASAHGFRGEYIADELNYRTQKNPLLAEPWTYSEIVAAKYYARGIITNLGLNFTVGLAEMEPGNYDLAKMRMVQNLATIMAGARPVSLPVEIQSEATNIKSYSFSLSNGDKLIALWTDGVAMDEAPGVNATLIVQNIISEDVTGIDVLNGYQQSIKTKNENGNLVIPNLIVRDYPLMLRVKISSIVKERLDCPYECCIDGQYNLKPCDASYECKENLCVKISEEKQPSSIEFKFLRKIEAADGGFPNIIFANNRFYVSYQVGKGDVIVKVYDENFTFTGEEKKLTDDEGWNWDHQMVFGDGYFYLVNPSYLRKFDSNWTEINSVLITGLPGVSLGGDMLLHYADGSIYHGFGVGNIPPGIEGKKPDIPDNLYIQKYDENLEFENDIMLKDVGNIGGSSMMLQNGIFIVVTSDKHWDDSSLIVVRYDEDWNFIDKKTISAIPNAGEVSPMGLLFENGLYFVTHIYITGDLSQPVTGEPVCRCDVMLKVFDQDWNLLNQTIVTEELPADVLAGHARAPHLALAGNKIYVAYGIDKTFVKEYEIIYE